MYKNRIILKDAEVTDCFRAWEKRNDSLDMKADERDERQDDLRSFCVALMLCSLATICKEHGKNASFYTRML